MKAELILDEHSLKEVLKVYMYSKMNGNADNRNTPFHQANIVDVKIVPKIKSIKVFFSYEPKAAE